MSVALFFCEKIPLTEHSDNDINSIFRFILKKIKKFSIEFSNQLIFDPNTLCKEQQGKKESFHKEVATERSDPIYMV